MSDVEVSDGIGVSAVGNVILVLWTTASRAHRVLWLGRVIDQLTRTAGPRGMVYMQVVFSTASPPDGPARAASNEMLDRILPRLSRMVTVALGDALWMNIVRAVMRGMAFATRRSDVLFTEATVAKGLDRIAEVATSQTPKRDVLVAELHRMAKVMNLDASALSSV